MIGIHFPTSLNFSELYSLLISALSVAPAAEANALVIKALRAAVSIPTIFDLQNLASLPCIQQLENEKDPAFEFLQLFISGDLETYRTFTRNHPTWLADNRTNSLHIH